MEKPLLHKVIEKLERLDLQQWLWDENSYGPEFSVKTEGLMFFLRKYYDDKLIKKSRWYHYLSISDWEGHKITEYYNKNPGSSEEKEISQFFHKLHTRLNVQRTAEFSDLLDEFFSEKMSYKTSRKEPELEKVIAKLEQLDPKQWKMYKTYCGPDFSLETNGLIFRLLIDKDYRKISEPYYHSIIIKNMKGKVYIEYCNSKKDSFEEKEIAKFYEKLRCQLEEDREAKSKELINNFLEG